MSTTSTRPANPDAAAHPHTKWGVAVAFGVLGSLIVGLVVLAFLWPIATATAKDLPIAITGPDAQVAAVEKAASANGADVLAFTTVSDRDAAVSTIKDRTVYGAIVLGASPEVLTASAGSPVATQLLTGLAAQLQSQLAKQIAAAGGDPTQAKVTVTDVVPLASTDKTGSGLVAASFPLVLGGMLGGILVALLVVGVVRRLVALFVYAIAAGFVLTLILQAWFGFLQGNFFANVGALSLAMLATAAIIVGFNALIGAPGIAVGAVITMLIGNPISGAALPMQFLVGPWGAIGQFFVPGAASGLVRELSYFPDADNAWRWWVLAAWAAGGLVLSAVGHFRSRATVALPARQLEAEPA
ncbi:MAG TPA: hypothetical protein VGM38_02880 [Pseudolysinimonas sp.]